MLFGIVAVVISQLRSNYTVYKIDTQDSVARKTREVRKTGFVSIYSSSVYRVFEIMKLS